jgi:hypothetical protein
MTKDLGKDGSVAKVQTGVDAIKLANLGHEVNLTIGTYQFKALGTRAMLTLISDGLNLMEVLSQLAGKEDDESDLSSVRAFAVMLLSPELFELVKKFIYASIREKSDIYADEWDNDINLVDLSEIIVAVKEVYDVSTIRKNFLLAGIPVPQALLTFFQESPKEVVTD